MVIRVFYETRKDGVNLNRTYSDANVYIRKVGTDEEYAEAIDVEHAPFTYVETDKAIETEQTESEQTVPIQDGFEIVN
jgi:hypothetical protein